MDTRLFKGCLTALLLLTFSSLALAGDYWVLGSFEKERNAHAEAKRLEASSGMAVKVAQFVKNGVVYNRVIADKNPGETHQAISDATGIWPWALYEDGKIQAAPSRYLAERQPTTAVETQVVYRDLDIRPPREGESLVEYCIQKARPKERELFCNDTMLGRELNVTVN